MDIFVADIRDFKEHMDRLLPLLPPARQERIRRAPTEEKKLLNLCAGLLLHSLAGDREILYGEHGKPMLPGGPSFSLSHAGNLAVLAVSESPVGVDVEKPRPIRKAVAQKYFQGAEQAWLETDPQSRFFFLWTRKEAVLKCCGRGLSLHPAGFSVLPDAVPSVEGMTCRLITTEFKGHTLSVATAGEDTKYRLIPFLPKE